MAQTLHQLLRERIADHTPAAKYGDRVWSWTEHLADASAIAAAVISIADRERPLHVGALLGNTPEMLTAMAAAALGGFVLCGINDTRRGTALARDIMRADCQILLTDPAHRDLLDGLDLPGVRVFDTGNPFWPREVAHYVPPDPTKRIGIMPVKKLVTQSEDVLVDKRGYIYVSDKNHGVFILRCTV